MIDTTQGDFAASARSFGEAVEPFLFRADKPLYGCLHRPLARTGRTGIVLCQPIGPEYIRSHRAIRLLAGRLTRVGCPVLRFDGYGCGDSAGDDEQADADQWVLDVQAAVDELRARAESDQVVVAGLRFGGSLAAVAGAQSSTVDRLVLWDPVLRGQAHLDELRARNARQLDLEARGPSGSRATPGRETAELLGFGFGPRLRESLPRVDLLGLRRSPARRILLIDTQSNPGSRQLAGHLQGLGAQVEYLELDDHQIWLTAPDTGVVPGQVLNAIVSWVARADR